MIDLRLRVEDDPHMFAKRVDLILRLPSEIGISRLIDVNALHSQRLDSRFSAPLDPYLRDGVNQIASRIKQDMIDHLKAQGHLLFG